MRAATATLANIMLLAAIGGCATPRPPPAPPPDSVVTPSFDGNYGGTIRLTSSAVRGDQADWCDTPPAILLSLRNNAFSYVLRHPNVPNDPKYSMSPHFVASVGGDGAFDATSQNGEAEMTGQISGAHMAGQINGSACGYAFTAERS